MLYNLKHTWRLGPLLAACVALGCAATEEAGESLGPVEPEHDSAEHAHEPHTQAPESPQETAPRDAGTRKPAPTKVAVEVDAGQGDHAVHAAQHAVDAGAEVESTRADAAKPAPDAQVSSPHGGEVEGVAPSFDAGAGQLQPDGKTVVYHIPNGTGNKDWNSRDNPIKVQRGMTLKLIDDDKTAKGGGHWLHSFGICPHSSRAIGTGYECKIPQTAKTGLQSGLFEHNVANAGGRIYLVVVD